MPNEVIAIMLLSYWQVTVYSPRAILHGNNCSACTVVYYNVLLPVLLCITCTIMCYCLFFCVLFVLYCYCVLQVMICTVL
jgi:hypothetical protein